jgi:hypothetical protein
VRECSQILPTKLVALTQRKPGTVVDRGKALRAARMLSRGKQGPGRGAILTNTDATNLLLATLIDHGLPADGAQVRASPWRLSPCSSPVSGITGSIYSPASAAWSS